ncbi:MAG: T9SS type A sorting domain-containing protein [Bacteroidia bacterium]
MKLLRLSMAVCTVAMFVGSAFAQGGEIKVDEPTYTHDGAIPQPTADNALNKAAYNGWKYPVQSAGTIGGTFNSYVSFLFEDSTVQWVPDGSQGAEPFFYNWHSVGAVFDPTDVNFEVYDDGIRLRRWNAYSVDSVFFPYLYVRYIDSADFGAGNVQIVDTLIFQFFTSDDLSYGSITTGEIFAKPTDFTPSMLGSSTSAYEVKIPLTDADSTPLPNAQGWSSRGIILDLPTPIDVGPDPQLDGSRVCGFSIAFKTMVPYQYGDTMETRDGSTPAKRLNYFGHSMFLNEGQEVRQDDYYNNSFWTGSELRYGGSLNGWENSIPGNAYFTDRYLNYAMHINTNQLSVDDLNSNMKVAVYPNPVSKSEVLKLDFGLVNADNVEIALYDLLGNKVKEVANGFYAAGSHTIDLEITDLSTGVYLYTVKAGNVSTTKKISITE